MLGNYGQNNKRDEGINVPANATRGYLLVWCYRYQEALSVRH